jgi:hypothetical protein
MKYSGIDLHSDNSAVVVTDGQDHVLEEKRVPNDLPVISPEPAVLAKHLQILSGVCAPDGTAQSHTPIARTHTRI